MRTVPSSLLSETWLSPWYGVVSLCVFLGTGPQLHFEQMEDNCYNLIFLAEEFIPQDYSSHSAEKQRTALPGGVDLILSPCSSVTLSFTHL